MHIKLLGLTWALVLTVILAETTFDSLFLVKTDSDSKGGCKSKISWLNTALSESDELVKAGLQAFDDAQNPSAAEHDVAVRYLWSYFHVTTGSSDTKAFDLAKGNLKQVQSFLNGQSKPLDSTPRLYCNDKWLDKLERTDVAWDADRGDILEKMAEDGSMNPMPIERVEDYGFDLWNDDEMTESNGRVPYWSDDLVEYVFDEDYNGKTYCTFSVWNLGVTEDQTIPSAVTLCPSSFTNKLATVKLGGKKPTNGGSIQDFISRSGTLYHELFHLVLFNRKTPDTTYEWKQRQEFLKTPDKIPEDDKGNQIGTET